MGRRERERTTFRGLHKKNTSPKPLSGKMGIPDYHVFINSRDERLKFWKSAPLPASSLVGVVVLLWRSPKAGNML